MNGFCFIEDSLCVKNEGFVKSHRKPNFVIPAKAGIQYFKAVILLLGPGFRQLARFASLDKLASYVGLIPDVESSGETEHIKNLTHRRNPQLRALLIEAAWVAARKDPVLLLAFNEYCHRMKKTRAIIKIARKLLNRIRYVLKNQVEYVPGVVQ